MQITIEYNSEADVPQNEEMTIYAIEKLLNGLTIAQVNQVLGRVVEGINKSEYKPPMTSYDAAFWDKCVMNTVQNNLDGLTEKIAGKLAKSIGSTFANRKL